jgi:hypothetical protein
LPADPTGVRGLTATADGRVILAAVHVGGIPRSLNGGETWTPTIPVNFDVHEIRAHAARPELVAAAAAVGLCVSHNRGETWTVLPKDFQGRTSLALAVLHDEALFSVQDGPFAKRSQIWRWRIDSHDIEQLRDGLPEWLEGKVDTNLITSGGGRTAILDAGGNLWLSNHASSGWRRIAAGLPYAFGLLVL